MNLSLFIGTILTSAADSLNPIAITQQFVLQGLVKKRYHICYFILATFVTNFACGMLAYYGLITIIGELWNSFCSIAGNYVYLLGALAGAILLVLSFLNFIHHKRKKTAANQVETKPTLKSVHPIALFAMGITSTLLELTSALPYFAFIGLLVNYELSWIEVILVQLLYNLIYASPLILMYIIYCKKQTLFDRAYLFLKQKMERASWLVVPLLLAIVAVVILWNSILSLIA